MMLPVFHTFGFLLLVLSSKVESVTFKQSSSQVVNEGTKELRINCSHDDSSLQTMLWYQHKQSSRSMILIGYTVLAGDPSYKDQFKDSRFQIEGQDRVTGSLIISTVNLSDSAVYFCAASIGSSYNQAFFGAGTKLTVLEDGHNITSPKVEVLKPSKYECRNKKDENRKKTIVCVASGFYPDHVSVSWEVNAEKVTKGVATDNAALRDGETYKITSRLRVSAEDWFKPVNEFKCIVSFYNGTSEVNYDNSVNGEKAENTGSTMTKEQYLKVTHAGKLSYVVFIIKSCIYGVFVGFLVWKLQGSAGKVNI